MATQVQFRRGTTTQNNAFTGAIGEITYDTEVKTLRLHDGSNAGGGAVVVNTASAQTLTNKTLSTSSVWNGNAVGLGYGGTGAALTAVAGAIAYSTGSALALSAAGTSGQVLTSGGSSGPTWVNAASITAGTATNATYATNINGGSAGQLVIQQDTGLTTFITAGANGTFLRSAGAGYAPTWATADVTVGSTVISLGSASTSIAGLTAIDATTGATSFFATPTGNVTLFSAAAQLTLGTGTVLGNDTTQNLWNTVATTVNFAGAATTLSIGASTGTATINNANVVITGNLTVNGTTTTVNSTTLTVDDKNIELGSVASPTDTTASGGGITLKGATDKIIDWTSATGWRLEDDLATRRLFTGTTSSTTATAMLAIASATYRSGELTMQVVNGTAYRILKLFFVHDGTAVTLSENYLTGGEVQTATTNTTFTASISAGTLTVFATASSGTSVIKGEATLFKV